MLTPWWYSLPQARPRWNYRRSRHSAHGPPKGGSAPCKLDRRVKYGWDSGRRCRQASELESCASRFPAIIRTNQDILGMLVFGRGFDRHQASASYVPRPTRAGCPVYMIFQDDWIAFQMLKFFAWGSSAVDVPRAVSVDPDDNICFVDLAHFVQKRSPQGEVIFTLGWPRKPSDQLYGERPVRKRTGSVELDPRRCTWRQTVTFTAPKRPREDSPILRRPCPRPVKSSCSPKSRR
jgi:hypothetical protein